MRKRREKRIICLTALAVLALLAVLPGCAALKKKKEHITLTVWHVYGAQTDSPLNSMIEEFNQSIGQEENISLEVTSVSNTNTIHEMVLAAVNGEPGAAELPDLFISYPKTVAAMPDQELLADFRDYFTEEELSRYLPEFLKEGEVEGKLRVFPVAKSTEILFVNKTGFDRFAKACGVQLSALSTWEGLFRTAEEYRRWTDEQTPETEGDGKNFFVHDYHFNYLQVGTESLGEDFFSGGRLAFGEVFRKRVWEPYAEAAVQGGVWLQEGYATEPLRTGDAIVSVASSASVLYYEDIVTYPDNISEPIEVIARPVPVFEGGEKLVMQRGAGFCLRKSSPEREQAAALFLKWLTEPGNNAEFVVKAGYMPVTEQAFRYLPEAIEKMENRKYKSLYEAFLKTQEEYRFYVPPLLPDYLELETKLEKNVRLELLKAEEEHRAGREAKECCEGALEGLMQSLS